jgi:hypothetical protein
MRPAFSMEENNEGEAEVEAGRCREQWKERRQERSATHDAT